MLLTLKLFLVPVLIAGVTLAARRWGSRVGGLATALPVVAGPTLCFYAIDQGNMFAAEAARATLLGLVAVGAFCVAYAYASVRFNWLISLLVGWSAFGVVTVFLYRVRLGLVADLIASVVALLTVRALLPSSRPVLPPMRATAWDVPLRMLLPPWCLF